MALDPVCHMDVDPARAAASTEYEGRTFYFCAPGCRERFIADPERYLAPDAVPESMGGMPGRPGGSGTNGHGPAVRGSTGPRASPGRG